MNVASFNFNNFDKYQISRFTRLGNTNVFKDTILIFRIVISLNETIYKEIKIISIVLLKS